jgi:hypothetical protein
METVEPRTVAANRVAGDLQEIEAKSLAVLSGLAAVDELRGDSIHLPFVGHADGAHSRRLLDTGQ